MVYATIGMINGTMAGNPDMVDSFADKVFWVFLCMGAAGGYAVVGYAAAIGTMRYMPRPAKISGLVAIFAFLAGAYYHFMFTSPW